MPEALGSTPLPQKEEGRKEGRGEERKKKFPTTGMQCMIWNFFYYN
jgi:hypothetical protein